MPATQYFPILKAKQGELRALAELFEAPEAMTPILEVVPWERDVAEAAADIAEIDKVAQRIQAAWRFESSTIYLDAAYAELDLEDPDEWSTTTPVLARLLNNLRGRGVLASPVVRPSASASYLDALLRTATAPLSRVAMRITSEDLDDAVTPLRDLASGAAVAIGVEPLQVDLLIDFGAVTDENAAALSSRLGRFILPQLDGSGWRTVSVAAGAFPVNLSDVAPNAIARLDRLDRSLWRNLSQLNLGTSLQYSDYAVTHPVLQTGGAFAAPPQLRYAVEDEWLVLKGRRNDREGHAQFYAICREVLRAAGGEALQENASWGDRYIWEASRMPTADPARHVGPGNASTWRAVATSHHLEAVQRQLASRVEL